VERLRELEVDLEDKRAAAKAVLAVAQRESRALTMEERARLSIVTEEIDGLESTIAAEKKQLEWDGPRPWRGPSRQRAGRRGRAAACERARSGRAPLCGPVRLAEGVGLQDGEEFFASLHNLSTRGIGDPRLTPMASMTEAVGGEGGFAVPSQVAEEWLDTGLESEVVRPRAQIFPMTSDTLKIPDGTTPRTPAARSLASGRTGLRNSTPSRRRQERCDCSSSPRRSSSVTARSRTSCSATAG